MVNYYGVVMRMICSPETVNIVGNYRIIESIGLGAFSE